MESIRGIPKAGLDRRKGTAGTEQAAAGESAKHRGC